MLLKQRKIFKKFPSLKWEITFIFLHQNRLVFKRISQIKFSDKYITRPISSKSIDKCWTRNLHKGPPYIYQKLPVFPQQHQEQQQQQYQQQHRQPSSNRNGKQTNCKSGALKATDYIQLATADCRLPATTAADRVAKAQQRKAPKKSA